MSYYDYAVAFLPLAVGHLFLPPLCIFSGKSDLNSEELKYFFEVVYSLIPSEIVNPEFMNSLVLDVSSRAPSPPFTWITYLFVHANYHHLLSNLTAAIQFGYPVHLAFGSNGMYFLFLIGGVLSSYPSPLYDYGKSVLVNDFEALTTTDNEYLPTFIKYPYNHYMKSLSKKLANLSPSKYIGSSGAVCAFLGADVVIMANDIMNILLKCQEQVKFGHRNSSERYCINSVETKYSTWIGWAVGMITIILGRSDICHTLTVNALNILRSISYIRSEVNDVYAKSDLGVSSKLEVLSKTFSKFRINHVAHIQGALVGASFAGLFLFVIPFMRKFYDDYTCSKKPPKRKTLQI